MNTLLNFFSISCATLAFDVIAFCMSFIYMLLKPVSVPCVESFIVSTQCIFTRALSFSLSYRTSLCSPMTQSSALAIGQETGAVSQLSKVINGDEYSAIMS